MNRTMSRTIVQSSSIKSVGYSPRKQVLEVEFIAGSVYQYQGVPAEVHAALMAADSKGRYFRANIRDTYPCELLVKSPRLQAARKPSDDWVMGDLSALCDYLTQEHGGQLPKAADLFLHST